MSLFTVLNINWSAIGSIASAIASLSALITVLISIYENKENRLEKQYQVQPWFRIYKIDCENEKIVLNILNERDNIVRINDVFF